MSIIGGGVKDPEHYSNNKIYIKKLNTKNMTRWMFLGNNVPIP
jgi:hypothetical protein